MVHRPGKYTVKAVYQCPFKPEYFDEKVRTLNAFWDQDPEVASNEIAIEIVR